MGMNRSVRTKYMKITSGVLQPTEQAIFNVCDVLLLLHEHNVMTDEEEIKQVKNLMLAGIQNPSHGFSVMCSTGAELLIKQGGLYIPYGCRKERYGTGIELFRRSARQVFWLCHWNMNAKSGKQVMDFS